VHTDCSVSASLDLSIPSIQRLEELDQVCQCRWVQLLLVRDNPILIACHSSGISDRPVFFGWLVFIFSASAHVELPPCSAYRD
jgi:hypothetical protein